MTIPHIKEHPIYVDYWLSTDGHVYSSKRYGSIKSDSLKEMKTFKNKKGYNRVSLEINGVKSNRYVHRLVAQTFIDNPCNYKQINHINGDKDNNSLDNIEWCSPAYNNDHKSDQLLYRKYKQLVNNDGSLR